MSKDLQIKVCIVDYGLGNLFSVRNACRQVGLEADISSDKKKILDADMVILPGVGAFGDAMSALNEKALVEPLREVANSDTILVGICLGFQLLMSSSFEFGTHKGLDIVKGDVVHFDFKQTDPQIKVPQVCWNKIHYPRNVGDDNKQVDWDLSPLRNLEDGEFMYFVHSYYVRPKTDEYVLSITDYGGVEFCSSIQKNNVFGFQFHPERSGQKGLSIYKNLATIAEDKIKKGR